MKFRNITQAKWVAIVGTILFFALAFVFALVMHSFPYMPWGNWHAALNIALLFVVLGAYYGTIAALDRESGMSHSDRPLLRTLLCGALAAAAVLLVQTWPPQTFNSIGPITGFSIGAILGRLGWRWAKYVDF